jgi:hypothetical protein
MLRNYLWWILLGAALGVTVFGVTRLPIMTLQARQLGPPNVNTSEPGADTTPPPTVIGAIAIAILLAVAAAVIASFIYVAAAKAVNAKATSQPFQMYTAVIAVISARRQRDWNIAALLFGVGLALSIVAMVNDSSVAVLTTALCVASWCLAHTGKQVVDDWRIKRRLFGSTEAEVRQLLHLILSHSTPNDFTDGGRQLPISQEAPTETSVSAPVAAGAPS